MERGVWTLRVGRIAALLAAGYACLYQVRLALGDYWFQRGAAEDIRRALSYSPGNVSYLQALVESGEEDAVKLLQQELQLLPRLAHAWIQLALRAEFEGDQDTAKRMLLQASHVDRTWNTSWALTNYYYRVREQEPFWFWARESLRLAHGDYVPLFTLCSEVEPRPAVLHQKLLISEPRPMRAYIDFLRAGGRLADAVPIARSLIKVGTPADDLPLLESVVDHLIDTSDGNGAIGLWNALVQAKWIARSPMIPRQAILNPQLVFPFSGRGFDWRINPASDVILDSRHDGRGVHVSFSGSQADGIEPLEVRVPVAASIYRFSSKTTFGGAQPTGLFWKITSSGMNDIRVPLSRDVWVFKVPTTSVLRIALRYERPSGVPRIEGTLSIAEVLLEDADPKESLLSPATAQLH